MMDLSTDTVAVCLKGDMVTEHEELTYFVLILVVGHTWANSYKFNK